jgi:2-methylcitrate dehydratase PrpD
MQVSIKPYACCRYNHGLIDCIVALKRAHGIQPEQVERVRLGVLSGGALLVAEPIEQKCAPKNVVDAQFSAPFAAAVALARGGGGPEHYTQATVDDPVIRSLMSRTNCYRDASLDAAYPERWPAAAEIQLRDGRTLSTRVEYATGEPENPVPREGLVGKFTGLASSVLPSSVADQIASRVLHLEDERVLHGIMGLLGG